jgi:hypothetical protein
VPGLGHALQGHARKALVFLLVLVFMDVVGLSLGGRLFPFEMAEPLVFLAAAAEWAQAVPRLFAAWGGFGAGAVTAVTYEYGNTFLIVAGLLNALVILDAFDISAERKPA